MPRAALDLEDLGGHTALIIGAMEGHATSIVPLLRKGANAQHEDYIGFTALAWALEEKHEACVRALGGCDS